MITTIIVVQLLLSLHIIIIVYNVDGCYKKLIVIKNFVDKRITTFSNKNNIN